jgi:hypothetical protein
LAGVTVEQAKGMYKKNCWGNCDYPSECRWGKQYGVQTPVTTTINKTTTKTATTPTVPPPPPSLVPGNAPAKTNAAAAEKPKTTFDDILFDSTARTIKNLDSAAAEQIALPHQTTGTPEALDESTQTKKPSMDDLLESAKRRKRKSSGLTPSPLASNPPSPPGGLETVESRFIDELPSSATSPLAVAGAGSPTASTSTYLQKASDDFELDVRKSTEKAGDFVSSWASKSLKTTTAVGGGSLGEEERAEAFVKGLRLSGNGSGGRKKGRGGFV